MAIYARGGRGRTAGGSSLSVLLAAVPGLNFPSVQLEGTLSPGHRADDRLLGQQRESRASCRVGESSITFRFPPTSLRATEGKDSELPGRRRG